MEAKRIYQLNKLKDQEFDLIVIGGGITGAGICLDAASRGLKTALVEKNDFASGTSSKSTKLIHGGLRYLKQFEIALVREVGRERATVHKLAPHLVQSKKMLLPIIKDGTFGKFMSSMGLMVYDILAGVEQEDQRKMYDKEETLELEPLLPEEVLEGSGLYSEYRTDDSRLTIEVIKTAQEHGAVPVNYILAEDFIYEDNKLVGLKCKDNITEETFEMRSKFVVSAAGPWVDDLRDINKSKQGKRLQLSKGVHIVVDHEKLPIKNAVYFDIPDGRMVFAIPRGKVTYVGTTDTVYEGDKDHVLADYEDIKYLVDAANHGFPSINITMDDVESSWAGLRPLIYEEGKGSYELSRKDEIFESSTGLISIAGGKLTGYRKMAEKVVDLVAEKMGDKDIPECSTDQIVLQGGVFSKPKEVKQYIKEIQKIISKYGLDDYVAEYLVSNYGRQTDQILGYFSDFDDADTDIRLGRAELLFTIKNEMVQTAVDFFERRTGMLFFDIKRARKLLEPLMLDLTKYLNWDEENAQLEKEAVLQVMREISEFTPQN
ncbi:MAG: glycerol-3-phosphate dehydrogenase/oxidase [bacterium]|nr:glycerol-3-phosphate dehydrogenase/oxidase [bacterium]